MVSVSDLHFTFCAHRLYMYNKYNIQFYNYYFALPNTRRRIEENKSNFVFEIKTGRIL